MGDLDPRSELRHADRSSACAGTQVGILPTEAPQHAPSVGTNQRAPTTSHVEVLLVQRTDPPPPTPLSLPASPRVSRRFSAHHPDAPAVCRSVRVRHRNGGAGGAEACSALSVGLLVRCFQQQTNCLCTYCERKL